LRLKPTVTTRLRRPRRASEAAALTASGEGKHSKSNGLKNSQEDSTDSAAAAAAAERALPIRKRRSHSMSTNGNHNHSPASPIPLSGSGEVEQIIASLAKKARNGLRESGGYNSTNGMNGGGDGMCAAACDQTSKQLVRDLEAKIAMLNEQLTRETRDHIDDMRKHLDAVFSARLSPDRG
jgi:hypothetical protein